MTKNIKSLISSRNFPDTYDENSSKIFVKQVDDTYDEYSSRIIDRIIEVNKYKNDYNILRASEMEMERQRTLKNGSLFGISMKSNIGNISSGLIQKFSSDISPKNLTGSFKNVGLSSLIMYGRAVGPLEELPIMDYIQDKNRSLSVISNTQTSAEHKFLAKVYQQKSWKNKTGSISENRYPINDIPGAGVDLPHYTYDGKNLYLGKENNSLLAKQVILKLSGNTWGPKVSGQNAFYPPTNLLSGLTNGGKFTFKIQNMSNLTSLSLPAYIQSVGEDISVNWESVSLINRSEDFYIYNRAVRSYSISFFLFYTNNSDDIQSDEYGPTIYVGGNNGQVEVGTISKTKMWQSMQFLHTLTRPKYGNDGTFISAPYCRLKVGDLFDHNIIVESANIGYDDLIWDINITTGKNSDGIKPMIAFITLGGKILHGGSPSVDSSFYPKNNTLDDYTRSIPFDVKIRD